MAINSGDLLDPPRLTPATEYGLPNPLLYTVAANNGASNVYADLPAGSSFAFTKRRADTRVKVFGKLLCFASVSSTGGQIGAQFVGPATLTCDVARGYFTSVQYVPIVGVGYLSGLPAGNYTVFGRWRNYAGTGQLTIGANISEFMMTAQEVW